MADTSTSGVYLGLEDIAALVGVSVKRVEKWIREGRLVSTAGLNQALPPRLRKLYSLGDVQALAAEERRVYHHERSG